MNSLMKLFCVKRQKLGKTYIFLIAKKKTFENISNDLTENVYFQFFWILWNPYDLYS